MNPTSETQTIPGRVPAWRAAGWSHPGRVRRNNEDRFHVDASRGLFLVIDGVGGQQAGEVAASLALKVMLDRLRRKTGTPEERLREAIALANNEIYRAAQERPAYQGMACVLTAAVLEDAGLTVGHVGDTRLYKIRGDQIRKLTHDHSPVGMREDAGELSEQQAMQHPRRNEIYRDVGSAPHDPDDPAFIQIIHAPCEADAALVLCSDGLTDLVSSAEVLHAVQRCAGRPEQAVQALIDRANEAGGKDNITVVVVEGEQFAAAAAALAGDPRSAAAAPVHAAAGRPPARSPVATALTGRWALFVYGLLTGLLLLLLLQNVLLEQRTAPHQSAAAPIRVAPDSVARFQTIEAAVQAARAGDVVEVAPGEYVGAVRLREGVQLVSRVPRGAVIRAAASDTAAVVALRGSRLSGFRVLGAPEAPPATGILVQGTDVLIEDVEVSGTTGAGIVIDTLSTATVRASTIHGNRGSGIVVRGGAAPRIVHNTILRNGIEAAQPGIRIAPSADPVLEGNVIGTGGGVPLSVTPPSRTQALLQRNFLQTEGVE